LCTPHLGELAEFLRSWEPRADPWESPIALASRIRIAAAASPEHFNGVQAELKGIAPIYVESMLNGLAEAANNRLNSWGILVGLSEAVIAP
jgi:hypothetical protein